MPSLTPVLALPGLSPDERRIELEMPAGLTVAEIVSSTLPGLADQAMDRARVWLVSNAGETLLSSRRLWRRIRPRPGVRVVIRLAPAGDELRSVLLIAVSIAATAIGQMWVGPAIATATGSAMLGQIGAAVAVAGLTIAGGALVNALIPPQQAGGSQQSEKPLFSISGWQNTAAPDGVLASLLGKLRVAPVFAAPSYTEVIGDDQYLRALFTFGYGPVELSDLRIKDTPLSNFEDVEYEIREGYAYDDPVTIYPSQVIQDSLGAELRRDRIRNASGDITGTGPETPVSRFTAGDATEACVLIQFPSGLIAYQTSGDNAGDPKSRSVQIRVEARPASGGSWSTIKTLSFSAKKREGFFRSYRWTLASRGRWEIRLTRVTHEAAESNVADRTVWAALQSFRPEYPINFDKPLCLIAIRVRATYQLNAMLDTFNALAERKILDWDHETEEWVERKTRNPASHFRHVLQGPEIAYPESDSAIALEQIQEWHDFCRLKGLKYDRNRDFDGSVWDALTEIAAAGRAAPRYDGSRYGVVIDRPQDLVVAHINSRNSRDFSWERNYLRPPHALRTQFLDETSDYQVRERVVRWPGYVGEISVTEELPMPGKTDPDEIWIELRRRQYEIIHRPDVFEAVQSGAVRTATRGDFVKGSYETLKKTLAALRVSAVRDQYVTLDGWVEMQPGTDYAIRFMHQVGEGEEATFESVIRTVRTEAGRTDSFALTGEGDVPAHGEIVQFGVLGEESIDLVVSGTQAGDGMTTVLRMLAQAPIIDQLTDAEVPPAWNGRAGSDAGAIISLPAVPSITSIETHYTDDIADGLIVLIEPGAGSTATVASFTLQHRLSGETAWTIMSAIPAGDGGATVTGYGPGDIIEIQVLATSAAGYPSAYADPVYGTVASPEPAPDPVPSASVVGGMGAAFINYSTPAGPNFETVRIYRNSVNDFGTSVSVATLTGAPLSSYSHVDGDSTKVSLVTNGGFSADTDWAKGDGWSITDSTAQKTAGTASQIEQALPLSTGKTYRFAFDLIGALAGTVTPSLTGGTDVDGPSVGADGQVLGALVAASGNTGFALKADDTFEGGIDNVIVYEQGLTSLAQGETFYWITAANAEGRESAPLALGSVIVI